MLLLDIPAIQLIIKKLTLNTFYLDLIKQLELDFKDWHQFHKSPRHAIHYNHGVIELMPCSDENLYSFKFVNGHPENTKENKLSVTAIGLLAEVKDGYPIMISEMTLLTAIRTAAVAALGAKYLARENSKTLAIIGTGAQSEFQAMAIKSIYPIEEIYIYDKDNNAMDKFIKNLSRNFSHIHNCDNVKQAVANADIIITATASVKNACLFEASDIRPGTHIHAMGGDSPGKTELPESILKQSKLIVEYTEQSLKEGEIQQLDASHIDAELWEVITENKLARNNGKEITIFDSVGFAIEDLSTLKMVYKLAKKFNIGESVKLIPELDNPKNLYDLIK